MNGEIAGQIVMTAAIYQREVCDVCLNCPHMRCINLSDGCDAYRAALLANTRKYGKGRRGNEAKAAGAR